MRILTAGALLAGLFLSGCGDNMGCSSYCVQLNGIENLSPADLQTKIKNSCDQMGKHGTPKITQQTKSSVQAQCVD